MPKYLVDVPPYHDLCSDVHSGNVDGKEVTPEILEAVEIVCEAVLTRYPTASKTVREFFDV